MHYASACPDRAIPYTQAAQQAILPAQQQEQERPQQLEQALPIERLNQIAEELHHQQRLQNQIHRQQQQSARRSRTNASYERGHAEKEKAAQEKEKAAQEKEKAAQEKKKAAEDREKAIKEAGQAAQAE